MCRNAPVLHKKSDITITCWLIIAFPQQHTPHIRHECTVAVCSISCCWCVVQSTAEQQEQWQQICKQSTSLSVTAVACRATAIAYTLTAHMTTQVKKKTACSVSSTHVRTSEVRPCTAIDCVQKGRLDDTRSIQIHMHIYYYTMLLSVYSKCVASHFGQSP